METLVLDPRYEKKRMKCDDPSGTLSADWIETRSPPPVMKPARRELSAFSNPQSIQRNNTPIEEVQYFMLLFLFGPFKLFRRHAQGAVTAGRVEFRIKRSASVDLQKIVMHPPWNCRTYVCQVLTVDGGDNTVGHCSACQRISWYFREQKHRDCVYRNTTLPKRLKLT